MQDLTLNYYGNAVKELGRLLANLSRVEHHNGRGQYYIQVLCLITLTVRSL